MKIGKGTINCSSKEIIVIQMGHEAMDWSRRICSELTHRYLLGTGHIRNPQKGPGDDAGYEGSRPCRF